MSSSRTASIKDVEPDPPNEPDQPKEPDPPNEPTIEPSITSTPKGRRKSSVTIQDPNSEKNESKPPPSNVLKPEKYKPRPYTFRVPLSPNSAEIRSGTARCPPFHIQLDHTLAVIWCLFSKESAERPLGIAQLQWALNFLLGIRNRRGEHPKDVNTCIQSIQDELLEEYAAMIDSIKTSDKSVYQSKSKLDTFEGDEDGSGVEFNSQLATKGGDTTSDFDDTPMTVARLPFSVTYAEMIQNCPNTVEQLYQAGMDQSMTDSEIQRELDEIKKATGASSGVGLDGTISKDNMTGFLNAWREEQLDKIQAELKRLHSIEAFIANADKDNFEPYLDNKQLDVLVADKVNGNGN